MHESSQSQYTFSDPLLNRLFLSPEEKANKKTGKEIMKAIYTKQMAGGSNLTFWAARNSRWIANLLWAKGSQPMTEFMDYMNINLSQGNKAWVNIDTTQTRIAAQFVGTLVESMAKNKTYACVNATDDGSINEKEDRYLDAIFRMQNAEVIGDIQEQAGVTMEAPNSYVPDNEQSAKVYFELKDRLPKEIRFEKIIAAAQNSINFDRILNRKTLYDEVVLNCAATKIEKIGPKNYTVRKCIPTNLVYNFFINDNGQCELTLIGEFYNLKVKDFRSRFGKTKDRPDGLTEKEIFELARISQTNDKNIGVFNYIWDNRWNNNSNVYYNRPYDDCSILVFDAEIDFEEELYYVSKKDDYGRENLTVKKSVPYQLKTKDGGIIEQPKPDNVEIIQRKKNTWMRGVYCPFGDTILYWGRPDLIIAPFTNTAKPLSSYTINIPNNDGEYVPSLFERIMEPLREYQLVKLKRKQLIAQVEPDGYKIDIESARNIDLGQGDSVPWEELIRIKRQTGVELWSSKGVDPLAQERPAISEGVHSQTISKIIELSNVANSILMEIRQLIGVPMYRDGSDVGERTSGVLQEQQNASSYNVTDFILNANNQLWEETFYKLCLLHWNDVVREEPESQDDMINTRFEVSVKMKLTEYERQLIEKDIDRYSQVVDANGNPALSPQDAIMIRNIDNYKMAVQYLADVVDKNRQKAIKDSERLQAQNAKVQQESLLIKSQEDQKLEDKKLSAEKELEEFKALQQMKVKILEGSMQIAGKGETPTPPAWLATVISQLVPNIVIPLEQENKNMVEGIQQQEMMEQVAMQQQMMQQQDPNQQIPMQ